MRRRRLGGPAAQWDGGNCNSLAHTGVVILFDGCAAASFPKTDGEVLPGGWLLVKRWLFPVHHRLRGVLDVWLDSLPALPDDLPLKRMKTLRTFLCLCVSGFAVCA